MSNIRLVLLTKRPDEKGLFPIELIYQIRRRRAYFRTKEKLHAENWSTEKQIAVYLSKARAKELLPKVDYDLLPTSREVDAINNRHGSIKEDISAIEDRYRLDRILPTPKMVIDDLKRKRAFTTFEDQPANQVYDFIDKYIEDNKASRVKGSLSVYKSLKNHLKNFQGKTKKKVTFDKIDYGFFLEFQNYLIGTTSRGAADGLGNVTIAKILSTLKTFLNYAKKNGIVVSNLYESFSIKKENLEVIALTSEEFETLFNFDLKKNKRLDQVRDAFCFSCVTGLRYSDLKQLKREHITEGEIKITVTKTKEALSIPINPYSFKILNKYRDYVKPLPVISNDKMNEYIKEICKMAKIDTILQIVRFRGAKRIENSYPKHELISVHTGRKTFATLSLEKGMSAEEVMKIGGWKTWPSFARYVNITNKRSKVVMNKAWGEVANKLRAV